MNHGYAILTVLGLLAACQPAQQSGLPGDADDHRPFSQIPADAVVHFTGTEPFWGGQAQGDRLTYQTPENAKGVAISVKRFAGRGGLSFSGNLDGSSFDMMVTPGKCSDGMSDRAYPFVVTLKVGEETRQGCGWTDDKGAEESKHP